MHHTKVTFTDFKYFWRTLLLLSISASFQTLKNCQNFDFTVETLETLVTSTKLTRANAYNRDHFMYLP